MLALIFPFQFVALKKLFPDSESVLWYPEERVYVDPSKPDELIPFEDEAEKPSVNLSLIVPAYNEAKRIPVMLDATLAYLKRRSGINKAFTWEIIIVDDGSRDDQNRVVDEYIKREGVQHIRLLRLKRNRGKGGAVKRVRTLFLCFSLTRCRECSVHVERFC